MTSRSGGQETPVSKHALRASGQRHELFEEQTIQSAEAHFRLGISLQQEGRLKDAIACYEKAVRLKPGFTEAYRNAGIACHLEGRLQEAIFYYGRALAWRPDLGQLHYNSGNALLDLGDLAGAVDAYRRAIDADSGCAEFHYNLGNALHKSGKSGEAADCYRQALKLRPCFYQAWNNLGILLKDQNRLEEAISCYCKALAGCPGYPQAHFNLGVALQVWGKFHEGLLCYEQALRHDPSYAPARWLSLLSLPIIYRSDEEVEYYHRRFSGNLDRLIAETRLETPKDKKNALEGCGSTTNFYLAFQEKEDLDLRKKYGTLVGRIMAANYPQFSKPVPMPDRQPGEKIRVGFVSSFMRAHTVGVFLLGWIGNIDPQAFEIFGYHIGNETDLITDRIRESCHRFCHIPQGVEQAASKIYSDRMHVLIFTDIGMNASATQLAALRLAPVQCKGWGYPLTTGLPTMDYYLTSDLMEPENAQEHYSETLIRLPNLALAYREPDIPANPKTREEFGIPEGSVVYLSTQSLFKYLPRFDDIYPRIARQVPNACFVFLSHEAPLVTAAFQERLSAAFSRSGLPMDDFCRFQPRLSFPDFLRLNLAGDILLDTLSWSGGKTTLEGIACGLPVVTCPGRFMRGRHAFAMLKRMGVTETIATDQDTYVRIAVKLGTEPGFLQAIRQKIRANRHKLYGDTSCVRAMEDFFGRWVPIGRSSAAPLPPLEAATMSAPAGTVQ